jgi:hypothetical protein
MKSNLTRGQRSLFEESIWRYLSAVQRINVQCGWSSCGWRLVSGVILLGQALIFENDAIARTSDSFPSSHCCNDHDWSCCHEYFECDQKTDVL